jgi:dual specificity phosphatase 12
LLLALGIRRFLLAFPDPGAQDIANACSPVSGDASTSVSESKQAAAVAEAAAIASTMGLEACTVQRSREALDTGQATVLLLEVCRWIEEGIHSGCVLVVGPLSVPGAPAVWFAAAFLAATGNASAKQPVAKAFASCRAAFPTCRMSAVQATEANSMLIKWREEGPRTLQAGSGRRKGVTRTGAGVEAEAGGSSWLVPCSPLLPTSAGPSTPAGAPSPAVPREDSPGHAKHADSEQLNRESTSPSLQQPSQPALHNTVALVTLATAIAPEARLSTPIPHGVGSTAIDAAAVAVAHGSDAAETAEMHVTPAPQPTVWYRCRKCRTPIFSGAMLEAHEEGKGQTAFKYSRRDVRGGNNSGCTSHFLNPDATATLSEIEGKICCPRCSARIGGYHWAGMQCSCGAWVAPAVQVVKSKVDESLIMSQALRAF